MTPAQTLRQKGFKAALVHRGAALKLLSTSATYIGLIQLVAPESGEYTLDPPLAMSAALHFLRSDAPAAFAAVQIGDVFVDEADQTGYRVKRIEDQPANVAIVFHTETFHDPDL